MAGYSATPLARKLGIKAGSRVYVRNGPADYNDLVAPLPADVRLLGRLANDIDLVHCFTKSRAELARLLVDYRERIRQDGVIWVSWPKKASGVATDVTEDVIRDVALPLGLVDVKVCAVDEVWSGLKLVIRRKLRR